MPILNKPSSSNLTPVISNYEGLLFHGYAQDDLKKYQMCQLACDISRVSNSSVNASPFYTTRIYEVEEVPITLWGKIDENRILFFTIESILGYIYVSGTVLLTNTNPDTPVTPVTEYKYSNLVFYKNLNKDAFCFCLLSNKDRELFIMKCTYPKSGIVQNTIHVWEITSANELEYLSLDEYSIPSPELVGKQCFAFSNYVDNQFILVEFDETTGNLFTGRYEIDLTSTNIKLLNSKILTGFTGYNLLRLIQLDDNDFYGVFSNVVNSITIIYIYHIKINETPTSWKVDEFNLGREYPTISCSYDEGYITVLCGYDNVSMRAFIYFISERENIIEVYKKNRNMTQPNVFDAVQGIMTLNNGLAYMTYSSTLAKHNAGFAIMDDSNNPVTFVDNITQLPNTFSAKSPPLICNNNVYFVSTLQGERRTYYYQVFSFFITPTIKEFRPYNNQFGVCQMTVNKNDETSLLYTSPIGKIIDMG